MILRKVSPPNLIPFTLHQELLKLDFYLSLFLRKNEHSGSGSHSHFPSGTCSSAIPRFSVLCLYVCVYLISHSPLLLVRLMQNTHSGLRHWGISNFCKKKTGFLSPNSSVLDFPPASSGKRH
jgi:hypothetical protein